MRLNTKFHTHTTHCRVTYVLPQKNSYAHTPSQNMPNQCSNNHGDTTSGIPSARKASASRSCRCSESRVCRSSTRRCSRSGTARVGSSICSIAIERIERRKKKKKGKTNKKQKHTQKKKKEKQTRNKYTHTKKKPLKNTNTKKEPNWAPLASVEFFNYYLRIKQRAKKKKQKKQRKTTNKQNKWMRDVTFFLFAIDG